MRIENEKAMDVRTTKPGRESGNRVDKLFKVRRICFVGLTAFVDSQLELSKADAAASRSHYGPALQQRASPTPLGEILGSSCGNALVDSRAEQGYQSYKSR